MSDADDVLDCDPMTPASLDGAVRALRADVPVRGEWRDALLREAAALPAPRRTTPVSRRVRRLGEFLRAARRPAWVLSPSAGVAAALLCAALGAGVAWGVMRRAESAAVPGDVAVASAPASGWAVPAVRFALTAPGASRVALVGDFNGWNPAATPLRASADGRTWSVALPLTPGRHVYAFVVDGSLTADPVAPRAADEDFGTPSSVIMVAESSP
ncbi:MAG TPA: isoamylase early set domain-containing protein [Gemmatimonadaceae bacterium]|nr:isoamylase early set domain-containing protein [Gemmatimonadaceae bacterium]